MTANQLFSQSLSKRGIEAKVNSLKWLPFSKQWSITAETRINSTLTILHGSGRKLSIARDQIVERYKAESNEQPYMPYIVGCMNEVMSLFNA